MNKEEQNLNNTENSKLGISDVIHSNMVDGQLDAVGALTQIFDEECAKAVIKGIENRQDLIDFIIWLNKEKKLGYTQVGLERIVDNYIQG
jgi:hypothetical protein